MSRVVFRGGFLRIHESALHAFGAPGGEVWKLVDDVVEVAGTTAIALAPVRYGALKLGIRRRRPVYNPASRTATAFFSSTAPYSLFVIEGTKSMIRPKRSKVLSLAPHPAGGYFGPTFARAVRGQRANDFMTPALKAGMRSQGL